MSRITVGLLSFALAGFALGYVVGLVDAAFIHRRAFRKASQDKP